MMFLEYPTKQYKPGFETGYQTGGNDVPEHKATFSSMTMSGTAASYEDVEENNQDS